MDNHTSQQDPQDNHDNATLDGCHRAKKPRIKYPKTKTGNAALEATVTSLNYDVAQGATAAEAQYAYLLREGGYSIDRLGLSAKENAVELIRILILAAGEVAGKDAESNLPAAGSRKTPANKNLALAGTRGATVASQLTHRVKGSKNHKARGIAQADLELAASGLDKEAKAYASAATYKKTPRKRMDTDTKAQRGMDYFAHQSRKKSSRFHELRKPAQCLNDQAQRLSGPDRASPKRNMIASQEPPQQLELA